MEQYIKKSALVAEIEKRKHRNILNEGAFEEDIDILSLINTLEVKEVDINKEISQFINTNFEKATIGHKLSLRRTAKHFFELGIKATQKGE